MDAQSIYDTALDLMKTSNSTIAIPAFQEDQALSWINWLRDQYFTQTEMFRITTVSRIPAATALASAYTAGSTTMELDSVSGFNGAFKIGDEIGFHTGTSTPNLTAVFNVNTDYVIDSGVQPLLKLPAMISLHDIKVGNVEIEPTLIRTENGTFLNYSSAGAAVTYTYSYLPAPISELSDDVKIDNPYHYYIVFGLIKIWKEVMESTQDTSLETSRMNAIVQQAVAKKMQGRKLNITSFSRYTHK